MMDTASIPATTKDALLSMEAPSKYTDYKNFNSIHYGKLKDDKKKTEKEMDSL